MPDASNEHRDGNRVEMRVGDEMTKSRSDRIRVKNRRKRYLDLHPKYFDEPELELADPLLYDRLIRCFQSSAEREQEGKAKGYSGKLESDLLRSEAKVHALNNPDPNSPLVYTQTADGSITALEQDGDERAQSREDGKLKWREFAEDRFLAGEDQDFEYANVDGNEAYDDWEAEGRGRLEEWIEGEEEAFVGVGRPEGETGVLDY